MLLNIALAVLEDICTYLGDTRLRSLLGTSAVILHPNNVILVTGVTDSCFILIRNLSM
jgi:hypothetical protein